MNAQSLSRHPTVTASSSIKIFMESARRLFSWLRTGAVTEKSKTGNNKKMSVLQHFFRHLLNFPCYEDSFRAELVQIPHSFSFVDSATLFHPPKTANAWLHAAHKLQTYRHCIPARIHIILQSEKWSVYSCTQCNVHKYEKTGGEILIPLEIFTFSPIVTSVK